MHVPVRLLPYRIVQNDCTALEQRRKRYGAKRKESDPRIDGVRIFPSSRELLPVGLSFRPVVRGKIDWKGPDGKNRQIDADERHGAHAQPPCDSIGQHQHKHYISGKGGRQEQARPHQPR
jgi:hypothetical protein